MPIPTHLWKVCLQPQAPAGGACLITNDETRTYSALSVGKLERMIGIAPLSGMTQRVRDTMMSLPAPSSNGSRQAGKQGGAGSADNYSLTDLARWAIQTVETILKNLMT